MLGNRSGSQSQLLGFENLGILRCCVLFLLCVLSLFLFLTFSLSLSLPLSLYSFCSGHNIDYDSGIFLRFVLFGCCVILLFIAFGVCHYVGILFLFIKAKILTDKQWNIFIGICIYFCLSRATIFIDKKWNIFVGICIVYLYYVSLLFIRGLVSCFSRSGWVHLFLLFFSLLA